MQEDFKVKRFKWNRFKSSGLVFADKNFSNGTFYPIFRYYYNASCFTKVKNLPYRKLYLVYLQYNTKNAVLKYGPIPASFSFIFVLFTFQFQL